jgi:hypothetical protein
MALQIYVYLDKIQIYLKLLTIFGRCRMNLDICG